MSEVTTGTSLLDLMGPATGGSTPLVSMSGKKLTNTALVNELLSSMMNVIAGFNGDMIADAIMPKIQERVEQEIGVIPKRVEVKIGDSTRKVTGTTHEVFGTVLQMVSCDIPVYLTGKAGTGKNVICKQVAEALGLDFYFTNAVTQEYKLTGFIDANGKYQETQFYKAFTKGGLFFLDEMDASVPETLVILNAAIANKYFDFPCGKVDADPKFRVIAAGNTLGTGADINYTGRYCLDRASLDRFALINVDYSRSIEKAITNNNEPLVDFAESFRDVCDDAGIECLCSYRALDRISKLEKVADSLSGVLEISLFKGLDNDSRNIIIEKLKNKPGMAGNKYCNAIPPKRLK